MVPSSEITEELDIPKKQTEVLHEVQQGQSQLPPPLPPLPPPHPQQQQQQPQQQPIHFLPVPPPSISAAFSPIQISTALPPPPPPHANVTPVPSGFTTASVMQVENVIDSNAQMSSKAIPAVAALVGVQQGT